MNANKLSSSTTFTNHLTPSQSSASQQTNRNTLKRANDSFSRATYQGSDWMRLGGAPTRSTPAAGAAQQLGTVQAALTSTPRSGIDENTWTYFDQDDVTPNNPNACGTTSLSMILAYFGKLNPPTLAGAQAVDSAIRDWGGFSAPDDLMQYARSAGLNAEGYNKSSFSELTGHLDKGRPVLAMVDGGGSPHWVTVLSHHTDNGTQMVTYADPSDGKHHTVSRSEFEAMWKNPNAGQGGFLNDLMGYENYMVVVDDGPLPPGRNFGIAATEAAADGISDVANGALDIKDGVLKGKIGRVFGGLAGIVGGLVSITGAIPGAVGRVIEMGGDKALDWAKSEWKKGGWHYVTGALGFIGGGIAKGVGSVVKGLGNVLSKVTHSIGKAITKTGKFLGKGIDYVVGGIVKGAKAVGSAIAKGAKAVGSAVVKGVKAVGSAIAKGAKAVGEAVVSGVKKVGKAIAKGVKKFFSGW